MSKKIDIENVKKISRLARINLSDKEREVIALKLGDILGYIEKLNKLDTKDVEPMSHALDISNVTREDIPKESLSTQDALKNGPAQEKDFFVVPKII